MESLEELVAIVPPALVKVISSCHTISLSYRNVYETREFERVFTYVNLMGWLSCSVVSLLKYLCCLPCNLLKKRLFNMLVPQDSCYMGSVIQRYEALIASRSSRTV